MDVWSDVKDTLKLSLPAGVYNQWLRDSRMISAEDGHVVVGLGSAAAVQWVDARMRSQIAAALADHVGGNLELTFSVYDAPVADVGRFIPRQLILPGFPAADQNWTKTPDFYFDVVLRDATPTAFKVVGAIIRHTLGVRDKMGNAAEWWCGVSYALLQQRTGIRSRSSVAAAIWDARSNGWIKRRDAGQSFDYALRWFDEPVDFPTEDRPKR